MEPGPSEFAVAGEVHGDEGVPRGEGLELGGPNLVVAPCAVDEQDYLALLLACGEVSRAGVEGVFAIYLYV